jgi:hypothetical protein
MKSQRNQVGCSTLGQRGNWKVLSLRKSIRIGGTVSEPIMVYHHRFNRLDRDSRNTRSVLCRWKSYRRHCGTFRLPVITSNNVTFWNDCIMLSCQSQQSSTGCSGLYHAQCRGSWPLDYCVCLHVHSLSECSTNCYQWHVFESNIRIQRSTKSFRRCVVIANSSCSSNY